MADKGRIERILYITLSNLGDAMMALPAFDFLRRECPGAKITVIAAPRTKCIFENHPDVNRLLVFDKHAALREKIQLFFKLKKEKFDMVVDLKNTFYRWGIAARYKNPAWLKYPTWAYHASQQHLLKAIMALKGSMVEQEEFLGIHSRRNPSFIAAQDRLSADELLKIHHLKKEDEIVLVVPGSRSELKKWSVGGYAEVIEVLRQRYGFFVVLVGEKSEQPFIQEIIQETQGKVIDLSGQTTFGSLCSLILRSRLIVANDSGVLQIASYLDRPVVGIYGPTDYRRYGPWSKQGMVVRRNVLCAPCAKAQCRFGKPLCISTIRPYDVLLAVRLILEGQQSPPAQDKYKRILVVRTDRIGDVLLSTPVLQALRDYYPMSYIAMMVSPATQEILDGNPYLDRIIVFDKNKHKGFFSTLAFSKKLKKENFDVAVILHPTVRVHFLMFLAGIRERIGYDWKAPYFLTQVLPHKKQEGSKHELEYNFDLLKALGINEVYRQMYMPIKESSDRFVEEALKNAGISPNDTLVVVNPAASCVSKLWPVKKFAEVADRLATLRIKIVIVADSVHKNIGNELRSLAASKPFDFSGQFNLSELASLFKRSTLLISNDSGPVHIAVAVGTPVISIFGRNQAGLGPRRWGPTGPNDIVLYKKTDCSPCLAHACTQRFKCLEAITVDEVVLEAHKLLAKKSK